MDIIEYLRDVRDTLEDGPEWDAINLAMHEIDDLYAKEDELAALVREYFDAKTILNARSIEHRVEKSAKTFQAKLNATHGMVKAESALRIAAEKQITTKMVGYES
jgi:hypothetical protein